MRSFDQICAEIDYDYRNGYKAAPKITKTWFAYKNGESLKFGSKQAALLFSSNIEEVFDLESKIAYDAFWKARAKRAAEAEEIWESELRGEYLELSDKVYDRCYTEAYDRGHSTGYDTIASYMSDFVDFAKDIIEASE